MGNDKNKNNLTDEYMYAIVLDVLGKLYIPSYLSDYMDDIEGEILLGIVNGYTQHELVKLGSRYIKRLQRRTNRETLTDNIDDYL